MSPEQLLTRFKLTLTTLTPLHIGSGARLRESLDFVAHDQKLWVAYVNRVMRAMLPEAKKNSQDLAAAARRLAGVSLNEMVQLGWLKPEHFTPQSDLFKYTVAGEIPTGNELNECIKDVYNRPFLPGSTLKGALRSALLRHHVQEDTNLLPEVNFENAKFAAQPVEMKHFVPNWSGRGKKAPNYDLWRACRVGDSTPFPQDALSLIRSDVLSLKDTAKSIPLFFEGFPQGVTITASFTVEDWLFEAERWLPEGMQHNASRRLYFKKKDRDQFVSSLTRLVNRQTCLWLQEEQKYYRYFQGKQPNDKAQDVSNALHWLDEELAGLDRLDHSQMILGIGRGTGWRSKTLGAVLLDPKKLSPKGFQNVVKRFGLGKGHWLNSPHIPITRILASCGGQNRVPPGWVRISLELVP